MILFAFRGVKIHEWTFYDPVNIRAMKANNEHIDSLFQSFRDDFVEIIDRTMDIGRFFSSEEYRVKNRQNSRFFRHIYGYTDHFMRDVKGAGSGLGIDLPDDFGFWNFPAKFLNLESTSDMPIELRERTEDILERCFYYGLLYHLYGWSSSTRAKGDKLDVASIVKEWAPRSIKSYDELRTYDQHSSFVPVRIFLYYHEHTIKCMYKLWRAGFMKRRKMETFFKYLFFAGCLFGVIADEG